MKFTLSLYYDTFTLQSMLSIKILLSQGFIDHVDFCTFSLNIVKDLELKHNTVLESLRLLRLWNTLLTIDETWHLINSSNMEEHSKN